MRRSSGITYLGWANARACFRRFGILDRDRLSHLWIVGKTGTGRSTLLRAIAEQDLENGHGFMLLDPHGDLFRDVASHAERVGREVTSVDVAQLGWSLDPFSGVSEKQRPLAVAGLLETFKKIWPDGFGARSEHIARSVFWTLLEVPGATLLDLPRLFSDRRYRSAIVERVANPVVRSFWRDEFARWSAGFRSMALAPLQNKVGAILGDPRLRETFSRNGTALRLRNAMDRGQVILVNLSKGVLGDDPSNLLGSMLLSRLSLAALSRDGVPRERRRPFYVIADEFQSFGTLHIANMLGELRKYGVGLVLAHQSTGQLLPEIREAVAGNAGTTIVFRVGANDGAYFAREFSPVFEASDLIGLPNFRTYLRLLVGGQVSRPFSAQMSVATPCPGQQHGRR